MPRHAKRRKVIQLGAPQEGDEDLPTANALANAPSSSAWSIRTVPQAHPHTLTACCMYAFSRNLKKLSSNHITWAHTQKRLRLVPDTLITRLFAVLREVCPTILNRGFITMVSHRLAVYVLLSSILCLDTSSIFSVDPPLP